MKKPVRDGNCGRSRGSLAASDFARLYPTLFEWLETDQWDDGSARETTTLFIFADGGVLKVMMKDRDGKQVAFLSADSLDGLLGGLERGLADGSIVWKPDRPPAGRGRK